MSTTAAKRVRSMPTVLRHGRISFCSPSLPPALPRLKENMKQRSLSAVLGVRFGLTLPNGKGILSASRSDELPADERTRICPRCTKAKALSEFGQRTRRGKKSSLPYCRSCHLEYHKEWRHGKGRDTFKAANATSKRRYPNRKRARDIARAAVKYGEIRWGTCIVGGDCSGRAEMHHDDYDKPLQITWVCRRHHRALDRARSTAEGHK